MKHLKKIACTAVIATGAAFAVIAEEPIDFWSDGVHYRETTAAADGSNAVMICSPLEDGAEYTFPLTDEGEALIPTYVNHDGINYLITTIGEKTFYRNSELTKIVIPSSVTLIKDYNFCYCESLEQIELPAVTIKGVYCLSFLPKLKELDLSEVLSIEHFDLQESPAVQKIILPRHLRNYIWAGGEVEHLETLYLPEILENYIDGFFRLSSLDEIYSPSLTPPRFNNAWIERPDPDYATEYDYIQMATIAPFTLDHSQTMVYVPEGCIELYKHHISWRWFEKFQEYDFSGIDKVSTETATGDNSDIIISGDCITSRSGSPIEVYNLSGQKVNGNNLIPGIYVVTGKSGAMKVAIK